MPALWELMTYAAWPAVLPADKWGFMKIAGSENTLKAESQKKPFEQPTPLWKSYYRE